MRRWIAFATVGAFVLAACGGTTSEKPSLSEAFCNDVRAGRTPMNLIGDEDPANFASDSYGRMALSCPELLEGWRAYFEQWGINIDA